MNPYQPPKEPPRPRKPKIEIDWPDFAVVFFVVILGIPLIFGTVLEMLEKYGDVIYTIIR